MPQQNAGAFFLRKNLAGIIILITFAAVFTNVTRMYAKSD